MAFVLPFLGTYRQCASCGGRTSTADHPFTCATEEHPQTGTIEICKQANRDGLCLPLVLPPLSIQCHPPFGDRQVVSTPHTLAAPQQTWRLAIAGQTCHLSCSSRRVGHFWSSASERAHVAFGACRCRGLPSLCARLINIWDLDMCGFQTTLFKAGWRVALLFGQSALEPEHSCAYDFVSEGVLLLNRARISIIPLPASPSSPRFPRYACQPLLVGSGGGGTGPARGGACLVMKHMEIVDSVVGKSQKRRARKAKLPNPNPSQPPPQLLQAFWYLSACASAFGWLWRRVHLSPAAGHLSPTPHGGERPVSFGLVVLFLVAYRCVCSARIANRRLNHNSTTHFSSPHYRHETSLPGAKRPSEA